MNLQVKDFKRNGSWVKTSKVDGVRLFTKGFMLWNSMCTRCKIGGKFQETNPSYRGCSVHQNFLDFQVFVDWCQVQIGYGKEGFDLDKDLLFPGNRVYSQETCVFLPRYINAPLLNRSFNSELPPGVSRYVPKYRVDKPLYQAGCKIYGRPKKNLGIFDNVDAAFDAYRKYKEAAIKDLADNFKHEIDPRAYNVLMNYSVSFDGAY